MALTLDNPFDPATRSQAPQARRRAVLGLAAIAVAVAVLTVVSLAFGTNQDFSGGAVAVEVHGA